MPPEGLEPPSIPVRMWRIHRQEHLTRLNQLINREPDYDPQRPGLRTRGDHVPPNQQGEVKAYFDLDRVIGWVGGGGHLCGGYNGISADAVARRYSRSAK